MARPVTLFTGQWADLPLEDLAARCGGWGFDGLELSCWGDHFDVGEALRDPGYAAGRRELLERHGLRCWAIGNHLVGQAVCDPIDARHQAVLPPEVWGDGDPAGVRERAAERMKDTARAAAQLGVDVVIGFTGSPIWHLLYSFPPNDFADDRARLRDVRRAVGPDHRRLRGRGRALRARGPPHRDRLRLPDHAQGARGDRRPPRLRDQLRPQPPRAPVPRLRRLHRRVRRPHLPRPRQGLQAPARRALLDPRRPRRLRQPRPRLGLRLPRPRRRRLRGDVPRAQPGRLPGPALDRVGGRRDGPRLGRAATRSRSCAGATSRRPRSRSTGRSRRRTRRGRRRRRPSRRRTAGRSRPR